jgi:hypothetical protein
VTLALFHVCLQVAFYRKPRAKDVRRGSTLLGIGADPEGSAVPIWPVTGTQEWPPQYVIGDDTFLLYCRRWNPEDDSQPPIEHPDQLG